MVHLVFSHSGLQECLHIAARQDTLLLALPELLQEQALQDKQAELALECVLLDDSGQGLQTLAQALAAGKVVSWY